MTPSNNFTAATSPAPHPIKRSGWVDTTCSHLHDRGSNDAQFQDVGDLAAWMTHYFASGRDTCRQLNRDYSLSTATTSACARSS